MEELSISALSMIDDEFESSLLGYSWHERVILSHAQYLTFNTFPTMFKPRKIQNYIQWNTSENERGGWWLNVSKNTQVLVHRHPTLLMTRTKLHLPFLYFWSRVLVSDLTSLLFNWRVTNRNTLFIQAKLTLRNINNYLYVTAQSREMCSAASVNDFWTI